MTTLPPYSWLKTPITIGPPAKAPIKPKPKPKKLIYPKNPFAPWTDPMIQQAADERVNAQLDPLEAASKARTASQIATIQAAAKAAAELLSADAGKGQDAYDKARAAIQGLGTAVAQGTGGVGHNVEGTLAYGGTVIPGTAFEENAAAAGAYGAAQPGLMTSRGVEGVNAAARAGEQELLDLANKRPELRSQILDELYKREMDKFSARQQKRQVDIQQEAQDLYANQFGEKVRHDVANENLSADRNKTSARRAAIAEKSYNLAVSKYQEQVREANAQGREVNATASKRLGYLVDQHGRPILGPKGNRINIKKDGTAGTGGGGSGGTYKERKPYRAAVADASDTLYKQKASKPGTPMGRNFNEEVSYLMSAYGLSKKKARQAAIAAGWKPEGTPKNKRPNQSRYNQR